MTAFVSGFSRWYAEGVAGARLATNAASSGERDAAPSGTGTAPLVNAGSIGPAPSGLGQPDRLLALGEPGDEAAAERADDGEDDEERQGLVDRIGEQALLEDGGLEVVAGLLERRDQDVGPGAGDAAEEDRR